MRQVTAYGEDSGYHGRYDKSDERRVDMQEHVEALRWWYYKEHTSPFAREWVLRQRSAELARHDERPWRHGL
jgi:hypothetical protein